MDATTRPSPLAGRAKQIGKTKHTTCVSMLGRQVQASGELSWWCSCCCRYCCCCGETARPGPTKTTEDHEQWNLDGLKGASQNTKNIEESVDGIRAKSGELTPFPAMIHRLIAFTEQGKIRPVIRHTKDGVFFILLTGVIIAEC